MKVPRLQLLLQGRLAFLLLSPSGDEDKIRSDGPEGSSEVIGAEVGVVVYPSPSPFPYPLIVPV